MGAVEKGLWVPFTTSLVAFLLGFYVGFLSLSSVVDQAFLTHTRGYLPAVDSTRIFLKSSSEIWGQGSCFSPGTNRGTVQAVGLTLISVYVGATFSVAVNGVGFGQAAGSIIFYAPLEFAGLLLIAAAGFWPGHG